jgi:hypothetical protein
MIEVAKVRDALAFLAAVSPPLGFPKQPGQNWDALYQSLTQLAHRTAGDLAVVFDDLSGFARGEPEEFHAAIGAMGDAVDYWGERRQRLIVLIGLDQPLLAPEVPEARPELTACLVTARPPAQRP